MYPIEFPEKNHILGPPPGQEEECSSLHTWTDMFSSLSCWQLTDEEILELYDTHKLFVRIWYGPVSPPVMVYGCNPFSRMENGRFRLGEHIPNMPPDVNDIWTDEETTISAWELAEEEILEIYKTRRVYIRIWFGHGSQPPMSVYAFNPFTP